MTFREFVYDFMTHGNYPPGPFILMFILVFGGLYIWQTFFPHAFEKSEEEIKKENQDREWRMHNRMLYRQEKLCSNKAFVDLEERVTQLEKEYLKANGEKFGYLKENGKKFGHLNMNE